MTKNQKQKSSSKKYLEYIKEKPCLACGQMPVDPHHMEAVGMGGANKDGFKDYSCVPLCRFHHSEYHSGGLHYFEAKYQVNLWKENSRLVRRYFGYTD